MYTYIHLKNGFFFIHIHVHVHVHIQIIQYNYKKITGIHIQQQKLIYTGKILSKDDESLQTLKVSDGCVIHLIKSNNPITTTNANANTSTSSNNNNSNNGTTQDALEKALLVAVTNNNNNNINRYIYIQVYTPVVAGSEFFS